MGPAVGRMAKWGEGDERWIVEDRSDGQNVNSWHWSEKDITASARDSLDSAVKNAQDLDGFRFTGCTKFDGFVHLSNRRGRIKVQYSLDVELEWSNAGAAQEYVSGLIVMPEVFDDDPETEFKFHKKKSKGPAPNK